MSDAEIIALVIACVAAGHAIATVVRWLRRRRRGAATSKTFSDFGYSVEVDCRDCGQVNRVPGHRLRNRPKCGRCKAKLMPGKSIILCYMRPMDEPLRAELNKVWTDEDRLWQSLADHVTVEAKARADAAAPHLHVVN